jgi:bacterioferritin-associated ferredoxin
MAKLKITPQDYESLKTAVKNHYLNSETLEKIKTLKRAKKSDEYINWTLLWDSKYNFRHLNEYMNDNNISSALRAIFAELGEVDEICPVCGSSNSYCWDDCNQPDDKDFNDKLDVIYHIPTCSGFEWQCGKCKNSFADKNSPIMAEVYTHVDYSAE